MEQGKDMTRLKGVRLQKRIRVLPFLWINLSKSGYSVSIGSKWVKLNIRRGGVWLTGSLVGSGISYRKKLPKSNKTPTG